MSNKDDIFGGFEAIAGNLSKGQQEGLSPDVIERDFPIEDSPRFNEEDGGKDDEEFDDKSSPGINNFEEKDEEGEDEESSGESDKKKNQGNKNKDFTEEGIKFKERIDEDELEDNQIGLEDNETDEFELGEAEPEISAYVQEKLFDKFGWEIGEEDKKFESIDDVVEFINKTVEENSVPEFANDEVAALNEYVSNGGDLKEYYKQIYSGVDLDNIDLDSEPNQVLTIRESLSVQGYDNNKIGKRIERYRDTGILKEEAEEAAEFLKGYRKENSEKLLQEQENFQEGVRKQQQKFISDVQSYVNSVKDIKGISLSPSEKKSLLDYGLRIEADGKTKYQKEYANSIVKNFVESVFFTMKGDKLVSDMNKKASSKAAIDLKKKLDVKSKRIKGVGDDSDRRSSNDYSIFDTISSQISKPKF